MTRSSHAGERPETARDPAHAEGKRKLGPPPEVKQRPTGAKAKQRRNQPWVPTSGLVGRKRRSARRG